MREERADAPRLALPRRPRDYLAAPLATGHKVRDWLNARWRLRSCTRVGAWTRLSGRVIVNNRGELILGSRVLLFSQYVPSILTVFRGGRLEIGDRVSLNYGADIAVARRVTIGADTHIGTHLIMLDTDFHDIKEFDRPAEPRPISIGERVWIGNRVTILPGVSIGDDAVVGAGSVVVTDIPPGILAMGNPARGIKKR